MNYEMTTPDIAGLCERLRAALEGVTPGPWTIDPSYSWDDGTNLPTQLRLKVNGSSWHKIVDSVSISDQDAAFIALTREATPVLLDTLERQAAEIERLRSAGAALLAVIDETDSYQKRPGNGDWGVECACCMGELFDGTDRIRINIARAALNQKGDEL